MSPATCRAVRSVAVTAGLVLLVAGIAGCRSSQTRAHLPAPLTVKPGVTTKHMVIEAWGSPAAIRDEPDGRTVLVFKNEFGDGWGFALGGAAPQTWVLSYADVKKEGQTAEFTITKDGKLERLRTRNRDGDGSVTE